jgi:acetoacetyl-CoA synthetase
MIQEGDLLWQPTAQDIESAQLTRYIKWLAENNTIHVDDYPQLWRWSVENIEDFWASLWAFCNLPYSSQWTSVLASRQMPGAEWFPGMTMNYAEAIFSRQNDKRPMMLFAAEDEPPTEVAWSEVYEQAARLAAALRAMGVQKGDRVAAYLPNIPQAIVALLATASIGAVWSSCSPDFGTQSVLDRFSQIAPKVLIAVDGYQYNGKVHDRRAVVEQIKSALPDLQATIMIPRTDASPSDALLWDPVLAKQPVTEIDFEQVDFNHPLWVLFSSGTTGLPKPIVQSHGGIVLEHTKAITLHNDIGPDDRFFWYSSTGWMMWNYVVGALLSGATIIVYDGSATYPERDSLFALAEQSGMTYLGTSAAFIGACMKHDLHPNQRFDLSKIRGLGSTGSPLTVDGFAWVYQNINERLALESLSGGTDVCTAVIGGARIMPIYAGEIQGASLGAEVLAYDDDGNPVIDEVGELVITKPMPSMPIYFWNDPDMTRYQSSYFEMYPGVWRHGDWIKINERGGCVIFGRSDSTINRMGIRMGTSEIYRVVESFEEVLDSLIIDLELLGRKSYMPLFVVMREGHTLDDDLRERIQARLRAEVSPRHAPDDIIEIEGVPYTLSGKKMEVPIRKILLGMDTSKAANPGAMRNPEALNFFMNFASRLSSG